MSDEPDDVALRYLRRMDGKLDRPSNDVHDLKVRITGVEEGLAGVDRRLNPVEMRPDRAEKRLDLIGERA